MPDPQQQWQSTDDHAAQPQAGGKWQSTDDHAVIDYAKIPATKTFMEQLTDIPKAIWEGVGGPIAKDAVIGAYNPLSPEARRTGEAAITMGKSILDLPLKTSNEISAMGGSLERGDVPGYAYHAAGAVPMVGPPSQQVAQDYAEGNWGKGTGGALALLGQAAVPELAQRLPAGWQFSVGPLVKSKLNPVEQRAAALGRELDIPLPMSVQTGGKYARGMEQIVEHNLGSADYVAGRRRLATEGMQQGGNIIANEVFPSPVTSHEAGTSIIGDLRTGLQEDYDRLAASVHPTTQTRESAGAATNTTLQKDIQTLHSRAGDAYEDAWTPVEQIPENTKRVQVGTKQVAAPDGTMTEEPVFENLAAPVDYRQLKKLVKPIRDVYETTMSVADKEASTGLTVLRNIVDGPDYKSARAAEADLSALKGEARGAAMPELKDRSQGFASMPIRTLQDNIDRALSEAKTAPGAPNPMDALQEGRALTKEKYEVKGVLDRLGGKKDYSQIEPVQLFNKLVWGGDTGINQLRELTERHPELAPVIGRAYIDSGGKWDALGEGTKKLLFKDPATIDGLNTYYQSHARFSPLFEKEPVELAKFLTQPGDVHANLLRDIESRMPGRMPELARGYIQGQLDLATAGGEFEHTQKMLADADKMGPITKELLFGSKAQAERVADFIRLARMNARVLNTSLTTPTAVLASHVGTVVTGLGMIVSGHPMAGMGALALEGAHLIGTAAIARLLFNPRAYEALMAAMKVPANSPAGVAAASTLIKLAGKNAVPVPVQAIGGLKQYLNQYLSGQAQQQQPGNQ